MIDDQTTRGEEESGENTPAVAAETEDPTTQDTNQAPTESAIADAPLAETPAAPAAVNGAQDSAVVAAPAPAAPEPEPARPSGGGGGGRGRDVRSGRGGFSETNADGEMAALLAESDRQLRSFKYGDVIEGTIMKKDHDEVLVDIGAKSEGVIPNGELQSLTADELAALEVGDEVLVSVIQTEDKEGHVVLSIDKARQEKSWRKLQRQFENAEVIQAEVSGYNKGGLLVNLEGVRGFVPASQVTGLSTGGNEASKQSELARFVGQAMPLKIIEINRNRNRLILSERQAAQEQRDARKEQLLAELQPGQTRPGTVSSICDFGAFVDIGGADGLIHLSELSWSRVNHPSEVLRVGQPVQVYVMSVDERDRKIALSLKRTQPEPWSTAMDRYHLNQLVRGTITQLTDFGAFARLEDGIEGLIHVSELADGRVTHPRNVVSEGQEVTLRVIRIDPQRRRMGLSLKRAMEAMEGDTLPPQEALPSPPPPPVSTDPNANRGGNRGGGGGNRGGGRDNRRADEAEDQASEEYAAQAGGEAAAEAVQAAPEAAETAPEAVEIAPDTAEIAPDAGETAAEEEPYSEETAPDAADEAADEDENEDSAT